MRINYFSDVHLEFGTLDLPETDADVIIAAGDIGIHKQGLEWLQTLSKPVLYVAGNHEFYSQEYRSTVNYLREKSVNGNVRFMENDSIVLDGVRFLGCTMWTELGEQEHNRHDQLVQVMNDFRRIRYKSKALDFDVYRALHRQSKRWLTEQLQQSFSGKTIVITHHAPTPWSWDDSPSSIMRYAYCNDLKELMYEYEIAAWFHGHVHSISDYRCADTRVLCNPRGYCGRRVVENFDPGKIIDL